MPKIPYLKGILIAIVTGIVLVLATLYAFKVLEARELDNKVKEQAAAIARMAKDAENASKSGNATNDSNVNIAKEKQTDLEKSSAIKIEIVKKLSELDKKYGDEKALTDLQKARKKQEESVIRADGMWKMFCIRYPKDEECLVTTVK